MLRPIQGDERGLECAQAHPGGRGLEDLGLIGLKLASPRIMSWTRESYCEICGASCVKLFRDRWADKIG